MWIAPKIWQGQSPTMYSECSRVHPNRFTFGRVISERLNTAKLPHRVNPIFGCSSSQIIITYNLLILEYQQLKKLLYMRWQHWKPSISTLITLCSILYYIILAITCYTVLTNLWENVHWWLNLNISNGIEDCHKSVERKLLWTQHMLTSLQQVESLRYTCTCN